MPADKIEQGSLHFLKGTQTIVEAYDVNASGTRIRIAWTDQDGRKQRRATPDELEPVPAALERDHGGFAARLRRGADVPAELDRASVAALAALMGPTSPCGKAMAAILEADARGAGYRIWQAGNNVIVLVRTDPPSEAPPQGAPDEQRKGSILH